MAIKDLNLTMNLHHSISSKLNLKLSWALRGSLGLLEDLNLHTLMMIFLNQEHFLEKYSMISRGLILLIIFWDTWGGQIGIFKKDKWRYSINVMQNMARDWLRDLVFQQIDRIYERILCILYFIFLLNK